MTAPSAMGLINVTPRMALFGRLFLQHASNASPASALADAHAACPLLGSRMERESRSSK